MISREPSEAVLDRPGRPGTLSYSCCSTAGMIGGGVINTFEIQYCSPPGAPRAYPDEGPGSTRNALFQRLSSRPGPLRRVAPSDRPAARGLLTSTVVPGIHGRMISPRTLSDLAATANDPTAPTLVRALCVLALGPVARPSRASRLPPPLEDADAFSALLAAWPPSPAGLTSRELLAAAPSLPADARAALEALAPAGTPQQLGHALLARVGRPVDGRVLRRTYDRAAKIARWGVVGAP